MVRKGKSVLVQTLGTLTAAERRALSRYVASPYFNTRERLGALLQFVLRALEAGEDPDPVAGYAALYGPGARFSDLKWRQASSELMGLLRGFLILQEKTIPDPATDALHLAAALRRRALPAAARQALAVARETAETAGHRHAGYYEQRFRAEWEAYQFITTERRSGATNLQALHDCADAAFAARKLYLGCLARSHQAIFPTDYRLELLDAALDYADRHGAAQPTLALYAHCYRFLTDVPDAEGHFLAFRELLAAQSPGLPPDELRTLYLLAINFGIRKLNTVGGLWLRATLELYRGALERGLLLENGFLSRFAFNNIVAIALRLHELEWAETFVQTYKPLLERQWREATASLNLARIAYARRDHAAVLGHLQRADYKDPMNTLSAKTLQLKVYYETGAHELLESHLASMQTFIRRHAAIGYHRTSWLRVVQYTRQLMRLDGSDVRATAALRLKIEADNDLAERPWLLEMLG